MTHGQGKDAFCDQQRLLAESQVRTIFDIGANTGQTAAVYTSVFPHATIYCFEPYSEAFKEVRRKFSTNELIKPVQQAISDVVGKKHFYINRNSVTNSLLATAKEAAQWVTPIKDIENVAVREVPVTTIDDFCDNEGIGEIQILKMDIQGGELMALRGATEKLRQGSISLIYTEIVFVPVYEGQAFFYDIAAFLSSYGYTLFDMYNFAYAPNGQARWGDAIFIGPRLRTSQVPAGKDERTEVGSLGDAKSLVAACKPPAAWGDPQDEERAVERENARLRAEVERLGNDFGRLTSDLKAREQELAALREENGRLLGVWQAVENSAGWRLLNSWRRARERLVPPGSSRRKLYDSLLRPLRRGG